MFKWNPLKYDPWQSFWLLVWELSEFTGWGLGRFAPWVFRQLMGCKGQRIMENPYRVYNACPECGADRTNISKTRVKYCYANGDNPMDCKCNKCGHTWDERN
jgi:hypothetical protein